MLRFVSVFNLNDVVRNYGLESRIWTPFWLKLKSGIHGLLEKNCCSCWFLAGSLLDIFDTCIVKKYILLNRLTDRQLHGSKIFLKCTTVITRCLIGWQPLSLQRLKKLFSKIFIILKSIEFSGWSRTV